MITSLPKSSTLKQLLKGSALQTQHREDFEAGPYYLQSFRWLQLDWQIIFCEDCSFNAGRRAWCFRKDALLSHILACLMAESSLGNNILVEEKKN